MIFSWLTNLVVTLFFISSSASVCSLMPPVLSPSTDLSPAALQAERGAVLAGLSRAFLFSQRADEVQPIASISKLMTALVFLDNNPGWDEVYQISEADQISGGRWNLFLGEQVRVKDIFYTSLVASDNGATLALVHASGLSETEFVARMNKKAKEIGLRQTSFEDPTGLSEANVSTAREVALLAREAFSREEIRQATISSNYDFVTLDGREKQIISTDRLLFTPAQRGFRVLGGKTGYIDEAGYCFVGLIADDKGRELISVVLNSPSDNARFLDSERLIDWAFDNYDWGR